MNTVISKLDSKNKIEAEWIQICFVVEDFENSILDFAEKFGVGPWFINKEIPADLDRTLYRGTLTPLGAKIALGYAGDIMFEIVCPNPDSKSIFKEWLDQKGPSLHHFGFIVEDFEHTLIAIKTEGLEYLMTSVTPRGARVVMVDGDSPLSALEEYIEILPSSRSFYAFMKEKSSSWNRQDLIYSDPIPSFE